MTVVWEVGYLAIAVEKSSFRQIFQNEIGGDNPCSRQLSPPPSPVISIRATTMKSHSDFDSEYRCRSTFEKTMKAGLP
jgi:hypothetical protein